MKHIICERPLVADVDDTVTAENGVITVCEQTTCIVRLVVGVVGLLVLEVIILVKSCGSD